MPTAVQVQGVAETIAEKGVRNIPVTLFKPCKAPCVTNALIAIPEHITEYVWKVVKRAGGVRWGHTNLIKRIDSNFELYASRGPVGSHVDMIGDLYGFIFHGSGMHRLGVSANNWDMAGYERDLVPGSVYHINTNISHWTTAGEDDLLIFMIHRHPNTFAYEYETFARDAIHLLEKAIEREKDDETARWSYNIPRHGRNSFHDTKEDFLPEKKLEAVFEANGFFEKEYLKHMSHFFFRDGIEFDDITERTKCTLPEKSKRKFHSPYDRNHGHPKRFTKGGK